jgi:hypothetical protein
MAVPKKAIDIEKLIQWAINDELPKGQHVVTPAWNMIEKYAGSVPLWKQMRKPPDAVGGGHTPGEPHPDACVVARVLRAFDVTYALHDETSVRLMLGHLVGLDPAVGGHVPCVTAAMAVVPNLAALMIRCAVLRSPPPLDLRLPRPKPERRHNRHPLIICLDVDGNEYEAPPVKNRRPSPSAFVGEPRCRLIWCDPTVEEIAEQRAEYTIWWRALAIFVDRLNALPVDKGLRDFAPCRPKRSAAPWATGPMEAKAPLAA